jgi:hypothetical protein
MNRPSFVSLAGYSFAFRRTRSLPRLVPNSPHAPCSMLDRFESLSFCSRSFTVQVPLLEFTRKEDDESATYVLEETIRLSMNFFDAMRWNALFCNPRDAFHDP